MPEATATSAGMVYGSGSGNYQVHLAAAEDAG